MTKSGSLLLWASTIIFALQNCSNKKMIDLPDEFTFGYIESKGYTIIYLHELPVIPGGCDSVQWTDQIIAAKGGSQRYAYRENLLKKSSNIDSIKAAPDVYFLIEVSKYKNDARQEKSSGFDGPLTASEFRKRVPQMKLRFIGLD